MSNDRKTRLRARPHDYNVGFGKPPEEHRFKKGESGNPAGRPRGAKSGKPARPEEWLKAIVLEEAYRDITVGEGDRTVTMPMAQAVIRTLAIEAAKGKPRPQRLFTEMLSTIEQEKMEEHDGFFKTAMDYKLTWEEELERRERLGITDAEPPLPHPDHIELDIEARTVQIVGPMTKEEKVVYAHWVARKKELWAILEELQKKLKAARKHAVMKKLRNDITLTIATLRELIENPPAAQGRRIPRASKLLICGLFQKGRVLAQDDLSKGEQASWRKRLQWAYNRPEYEEALTALEQLHGELEERNQSVAGSLEEGLKETLTLHRLGVHAVLGRSFKTTNCLESVNALVEERCAKVDHWKNSSQRPRWLATALVDIEPRLRKVVGYLCSAQNRSGVDCAF